MPHSEPASSFATTSASATRLLNFNRELLEQALALVVAHQAPAAPVYAGPVGAHLRHLVEHFEALLFPDQPGVVDYDSRPRDAELEALPALARKRLAACVQALAAPQLAAAFSQRLRVRGQCGAAGAFGFEVDSTTGRELAFLASHTVHHYALLKAHCMQQGIAVPADFGQAPATVSHQRRAVAA